MSTTKTHYMTILPFGRTPPDSNDDINRRKIPAEREIVPWKEWRNYGIIRKEERHTHNN